MSTGRKPDFDDPIQEIGWIIDNAEVVTDIERLDAKHRAAITQKIAPAEARAKEDRET